MEILFITSDLRSTGLASRLVAEGHDVKLYSDKPVHNNYGFLTRVTHPYETVKSCKFIVADEIGDFHDIYKWARTFNKPIIGCSPLTDMMNKDCYKEFTIAQRLGVGLPVTEVLADAGEMYTKVLNWNPARTLIRYDRETISVDHMQWLAWAMYKLPLNKHILLQTPSYGEDITVMGWFDGLRWLKPFMLKTGKEQNLKASLMMAVRGKEWIDKLIEPWGEFLKNIDYHGPFTVRGVGNGKGCIETISTFAGIEFPSVYAYFAGLREPVCDFLMKVAFSTGDEADITNDYMASLVVKTELKEPAGVPIIGLEEGNRKHIFFGSVTEQNDEVVILPGPWVYTATAHGRDPRETFGRTYFTSNMVRIPEPNIPTGMSSVYGPWLNRLKTAGYL